MQLRSRREVIRDAILTRASGAGRSVFARAFADCFIDRITTSLSEDSWESLASWVASTYRDHDDSAPARAVFAAAPLAVSDVLRAMGDQMPQYRTDFTNAARHIAALADIVRTRSGDQALDALEEMDVLLASLVDDLRVVDAAAADRSHASSAWSSRLAERLELPKHEAITVTRAALIHDIGKTATPRSILEAPRALTDDEWSIVREHVFAGESMLRNTPALREFAPIVRSHHERYDGLGYPDGLDRNRIPVGARIVAIADAFTAMIGHHSYRAPLTPAQALEELNRCKGSQFDPRLVDAMADVVKGETA
ncbi:MAG TPA: HD domain-containing phosphohydrolase [Candidatus Tyrphobacter sp.]